MIFRRKVLLAAAVLCGLIVCLVGPAAATTWDAAADFSPTDNPTGQWTYGYSYPNIDSTLTPYTIHFTDPSGLEFWNTGRTDLVPGVFKNPTAAPITLSTLTVPPEGLAFHPGVNGEYSHVVWTAPTDGTYAINATFTGLDTGPTTTDVHILVGGISQFDGYVNLNGYGNQISDSFSFFIFVGKTVDFAVGYGNGVYYNDSTGLGATVSSIPLPPTALLLGSGLLGLGLLRRKWSLKK